MLFLFYKISCTVDSVPRRTMTFPALPWSGDLMASNSSLSVCPALIRLVNWCRHRSYPSLSMCPALISLVNWCRHRSHPSLPRSPLNLASPGFLPAVTLNNCWVTVRPGQAGSRWRINRRHIIDPALLRVFFGGSFRSRPTLVAIVVGVAHGRTVALGFRRVYRQARVKRRHRYRLKSLFRTPRCQGCVKDKQQPPPPPKKKKKKKKKETDTLNSLTKLSKQNSMTKLTQLLVSKYTGRLTVKETGHTWSLNHWEQLTGNPYKTQVACYSQLTSALLKEGKDPSWNSKNIQ